MKNKRKLRKILLPFASLLLTACILFASIPISASGSTDVSVDTWDTWDGTFDRALKTNLGNALTGGGTESDPYIIDSAEKLMGLAANVALIRLDDPTTDASEAKRETGAWNKDGVRHSKHYKLTVNIDFGGQEIVPIGVQGAYFEGVFDGDGHTVKNFKVTKDTYIPNTYDGKTGSEVSLSSHAGLFGYINGTKANGYNTATVKNLTVTNAVLDGNKCAPIAAQAMGAVLIDNCHTFGTVIDSSKATYVGGIIADCGTNTSTEHTVTIKNCSSDVDMICTVGTSFYAAGGILGNFAGGLTVSDCIANGDITVADEMSVFHVGGIVGRSQINASGDGTARNFVNCAYTGSINVSAASTGSDRYVGGIAGKAMNGAVFNNCAMYGSVSVDYDESAEHRSGIFVGGFGMSKSGAAQDSKIENSICIAPPGTKLGDTANDKGTRLSAVGASNNTCDYTGLTVLSATQGLDMKLKGVQHTDSYNFTPSGYDSPVSAFDVRFVSALGNALVDTDTVLEKYKSVGYVITAIKDTAVIDFSTDVGFVYDSINAKGGLEKKNAGDSDIGGDYIVAVSGLKIPAKGTVTFYVTPRVTTLYGTVSYGNTFIIIFTDGECMKTLPIIYDNDNDINNEDLVTLDGVGLSAYSILYDADNAVSRRAASDLAYSVDLKTGIWLDLVSANASSDVSYSIVIGNNAKHTVTTAEYGESKVYADGTTIYVDGTDIVGLERGISYLASLIATDESTDVELSDISHSAKLQDRSEYVNDATKFSVCYDGRIETSAEKLPLSYKVGQLYDPSGDVLVIAHRGEHTYYPENSLEGLISAWRIGAFASEIDIQKTSDGYWIAMHDTTLTRTTNVVAARAADPSLPTSNKIVDWTFEEIRKLRLLDGYGQVTPFVIPTLEEALHAADDRIFLHLDKSFNYVNDILPIMVKENVFECVYIVNHVAYKNIEQIIKSVKQTYGKTLHAMPRTNSMEQLEECTALVTKSGSVISPSIVYLGDFVKASESDNEAIRDSYSERIRVATWVLREADNESYWQRARSYNYSIFLTDHPYEFLQTIR